MLWLYLFPWNFFDRNRRRRCRRRRKQCRERGTILTTRMIRMTVSRSILLIQTTPMTVSLSIRMILTIQKPRSDSASRKEAKLQQFTAKSNNLNVDELNELVRWGEVMNWLFFFLPQVPTAEHCLTDIIIYMQIQSLEMLQWLSFTNCALLSNESSRGSIRPRCRHPGCSE